ncbi:MAG: 16S rRNA (cytidine(1402)-2'-O)-methyltransferase [Bacillota bacterium]
MAGGTLYICATPIGNLSDITLRVLDVLARVDFIAAEDTRQTRKLLSHYDISANMISYHEHNKHEAGERILQLLGEGKDVALVTDSGMPGISDPGEDICAAVIERRLNLQVVPGPSASLTALVLSGLSTARFAFEGFLPRRGQERAQRLEQLAAEPRTMVIYESPQRVVQTLEDLGQTLGESRRCSLSRELTKKFEETIRGTIGEVLAQLQDREIRGECVLVVEGRGDGEDSDEPGDLLETRPQLQAMVREYAKVLVSQGASRRDAAKEIAEALGCPWRGIYKLIARTERGEHE